MAGDPAYLVRMANNEKRCRHARQFHQRRRRALYHSTASSPAGILNGLEESVAASQTASATSAACVTVVSFSQFANICSTSAPYGSGKPLCIRDRAFSPKRVEGARPGSTTRTRTLNCSSSSASDSLNALTADLLAV